MVRHSTLYRLVTIFMTLALVVPTALAGTANGAYPVSIDDQAALLRDIGPDTGIFRTWISVSNPTGWDRLDSLGVVILERGKDSALVLADDEQLETLARLRFEPQASDELGGLLRAQGPDKAWLQASLQPLVDQGVALQDLLVEKSAAVETVQSTRISVRSAMSALTVEQRAALTSSFSVDDDADGLTNSQETWWCTDPADADTDDDGTTDGVEIAALKDWLANRRAGPPGGTPWPNWPPQRVNCPDKDHDSIPNLAERWDLGLNMDYESTDRDKFDDGQELFGVTYCPGGDLSCGYGDLPRSSDSGYVGAVMPSWVKAPGKHPLVAAYPVPEVDVVESSLKVRTVTTVTTDHVIASGTEKSYSTAKTEGTSTSVADTVTWNEWQETSVTEAAMQDAALASDPTNVGVLLRLAGLIPTAVKTAVRYCTKGQVTGPKVLSCAAAADMLIQGAKGAYQSVRSLFGEDKPQPGNEISGPQCTAPSGEIMCRAEASGATSGSTQVQITHQSRGGDEGGPHNGNETMLKETAGTRYSNSVYEISYPVPGFVPTTTESHGKSWGGAQTTTNTKYEEHTVTNGEAFSSEESWGTAVAENSAHAADLWFTYSARNIGTEYAREIGDLAFNVYIGDDPNPVYTYFVGPDLGGDGKFHNFMPGEEHTYTARHIPLTLDQMRDVDLGGPIRVVVEDFTYGADELFYQDAANAGVLLAMEDGLDDGDEAIDTYLIPTWDSETVLDVLARYFRCPSGKTCTDADGMLIAIWTPEYRADTPAWCAEPQVVGSGSQRTVWCKHALSTADWWNVYTDGMGDGSEGFQDTPASPGQVALFRFNRDSDLDGYSDRSEERLGTDPDDAADYPRPELLAGVHSIRTGNQVVATLSLLNTGLYDAYGVEAVMIAPDDSVSITNNTVGGSGRVRAQKQVVVGSRIRLQDPLPAAWTQANHARPAAGGYYAGPADRTYTFTVQGCGSGGCDVGAGTWTLAWNDGQGASGSLSFASGYQSPTFLPVGSLGVTLALYTGKVYNGESFTVQANTPADTFQYTINSEPYTAPVVLVSYNDPQGNHRLVLPPAAMALSSPTADLLAFSGAMLPDPGVEIVTSAAFAPGATTTNLVVNNPTETTLTNAHLFLEFVAPAGTVVSEVATTMAQLPPGPTVQPVAWDSAGFDPAYDPAQDYIVMAFWTDYQGNILDTAARPLSSFQDDPRPTFAMDADDELWDFGTAQQRTLLSHTVELANVGSVELETFVTESTAGCTPPPLGMVSWWPGDEHPYDIIGSSDAMLQNGATYAAGVDGRAFLADGIDDYVSFPDSPSQRSSSLTIAGWFRLLEPTPPNPSTEFILASKYGGGYEGWIIRLSDQLVLEFSLHRRPNVESHLSSNTTIPLNGWVHIAATYDGTTQRIYIDGILKGSQVFSGGYSSSVFPLTIGKPSWVWQAIPYVNISVDELQIYERALSSAEIQAIFDARSQGMCKSPIFADQSSRVVPGNVAAYSMMLNTRELPIGPFERNLVIRTNDPNHPSETITIRGSIIHAPETCLDIRDRYPSAVDGTYTIFVNGDNATPYSIYCHDMGGIPSEYLTLVNAGSESNYSKAIAGQFWSGTDVTTSFSKIRINPITLEVDIRDLTFSSSTGHITGGWDFTSVPYATASNCAGTNAPPGLANINLLDTPFAIDDAVDFYVRGYLADGSTIFSQDRQVVGLTGWGWCGENGPEPFVSQGLSNPLKLQYTHPVAPNEYMRLPAENYSSVTLGIRFGAIGDPAGALVYSVDIGADGSMDWSGSTILTYPAVVTSPNLASAFNAYLSGRTGDVDVPIRITPSPSLDTALHTFQATPSAQPDITLAAADIIFGSANPVEGDVVPVNITVHNTGSLASGPLVASVYATAAEWGEWYIGSAFVANVPAAGTATAPPLPWNTLGFTGDVPVRVVLDPFDRVDETSETNNEASKSLTIKTRPDLKITVIDLSDDEPVAGETIIVGMTVANTGQTAASASVLALYDGNPDDGATLICEQLLAAPSQGQASQSCPWTPAGPGLYRLFAVTDRDRTVGESNEGNNTTWIDVHVGVASPLLLDSGGPSDPPYTTQLGYGYLSGEASTFCGTQPEQSQRSMGGGPVVYRFDHLLPGHFYHLDITLFECDGLGRLQQIHVDDNLIDDNISLADGQVHRLSYLLDPALYVDHGIVVKISELTGNDAVVAHINLHDIYYRYADAGGGNDPQHSASIGYGWLDGVARQPWGTLPYQTRRIDEADSNPADDPDNELRYQFDGLDPALRYQLHVTFYQAAGAQANQDVRIDGVATGTSVQIGAGQRVDVTVDVPPSAYAGDGSIVAQIVRSTAANAFVSEIALEQRTVVEGAPPVPDIDVVPVTLSASQPPNTTTNQQFTISNLGDGGLTWSIVETSGSCGAPADVAWASVAPSSGSTAASGSNNVTVTFNSSGLAPGTFAATLCVNSNDPDEPTVTVNLALTVQDTGNQPLLDIDDNIPGYPNQTVAVPIPFVSNGASIASLVFSIDFDQSCLAFDPTDGDGDGIPDAVTFSLPPAFQGSVTLDASDTDGELDFLIADTFPPLSALPSGTPPATIEFMVTCQPNPGASVSAPVLFSNNPAPSFGSTGGGSVPGVALGGSVLVQATRPGDCNADALVDAGDISAVVLEIFDGDGSDPAAVPGGTFLGSSVGCNANQDVTIDAGDISCTVLLIFNGPNACGGALSLEEQGGQTRPPALDLLEPKLDGDWMTVPIGFSPGDHQISSVVFAIDYDPTVATIDPTDANGDGIPDAVALNLPPEFAAAVMLDQEAGQVRFMIADVSVPLAGLPEQVIATVAWQVQDDVIDAGRIRLSETLLASFGDVQGRRVLTGATR